MGIYYTRGRVLLGLGDYLDNFLDMKKLLYIAVGVIVLAAIGAAGWFYVKSRGGAGEAQVPVGAVTPANAAVDSAAQASDAATAGAPSEIGKTNPFKANINPVGGYQNPFK